MPGHSETAGTDRERHAPWPITVCGKCGELVHEADGRWWHHPDGKPFVPRRDRRRPPEAVIDAKHLERQRVWSARTFGPGRRTQYVIDHIRKELDEIKDDPTDLYEWVDVIILAFDGAWRAGWEPQEIIDAIKQKQARNELRKWPDWREASEDQAIEHVREGTGDCEHTGGDCPLPDDLRPPCSRCSGPPPLPEPPLDRSRRKP